MKIGERQIGRDQPVFVIAEIGVNHDGSVERADELILTAKHAGADAVKLQVFAAERLMHRSARFAAYQESRVDAADPAEMLRKYELEDGALGYLAELAKASGIEMLATPFSPEDVPRVQRMASAIKIASPDLVNRVLLSKAITPPPISLLNRRKTPLPVILSTGAADADEIVRAVEWLRSQDAEFALLHCVSSYPVPVSDAQLGWIDWLAQFGVPVGYSDHTTDVSTGALAVATGACIVEKHITYDTTAPGPDHSASFDPKQFGEYVKLIRVAERMRGDGGPRRVLPCEADVRNVSRQSLVATRAIAAGSEIAAGSLTSQRPGTGISAERINDVVGRRAARTIEAGEMLSADMIEGGI